MPISDRPLSSVCRTYASRALSLLVAVAHKAFSIVAACDRKFWTAISEMILRSEGSSSAVRRMISARTHRMWLDAPHLMASTCDRCSHFDDGCPLDKSVNRFSRS